MISIEHDSEKRVSLWDGGWRGKWRLARRPEGVGANLCCPACGVIAGLGPGTNHTIAADGSVSPSVVCTGYRGEGCSFHEFVKLEGWPPRGRA